MPAVLHTRCVWGNLPIKLTKVDILSCNKRSQQTYVWCLFGNIPLFPTTFYQRRLWHASAKIDEHHVLRDFSAQLPVGRGPSCFLASPWPERVHVYLNTLIDSLKTCMPTIPSQRELLLFHFHTSFILSYYLSRVMCRRYFLSKPAGCFFVQP